MPATTTWAKTPSCPPWTALASSVVFRLLTLLSYCDSLYNSLSDTSKTCSTPSLFMDENPPTVAPIIKTKPTSAHSPCALC